VLSASAQQDNQERGQSTTPPKAKDAFGQDHNSGLNATGRMGMGQSLRASKLTGAEVKDSQSQSVGRIEDVVINPVSGRIEFAVISLDGASATGSTTSPSATTSTTTTTTSAAGSTAGKLVPVPWMLLRQSTAGSASTTTSTSRSTFPSTSTTGSEQQYAFTLNVDRSKLEQAPSFDRNSWPDISQGDWHQRIFSHYGRGGAATGGAESPSGTSTSTEGKNKGDKSSSPTSPNSSEKPEKP
jgi:sporulation protein YlmC with PRC-barrel domain